jgi:hypothetical protein
MKPVNPSTPRYEIRGHGELAAVVFTIVIEAIMANSAQHRHEIEVDPLRLDPSFP